MFRNQLGLSSRVILPKAQKSRSSHEEQTQFSTFSEVEVKSYDFSQINENRNFHTGDQYKSWQSAVDRSIVPRNQIAWDSELSTDDLRFFPVRGRSYCGNDTQYNNIVDVYTFRKFPSSRIIFKEIQTFKRKPPTTLWPIHKAQQKLGVTWIILSVGIG